jgi:hypothetical protein
MTETQREKADRLMADYEALNKMTRGQPVPEVDLAEEATTFGGNLLSSFLGLPGDLLSLAGLENRFTSEALSEKLGGDVEHESWLLTQIFAPGPGEFAGLASLAGGGAITLKKLDKVAQANAVKRWDDLEEERLGIAKQLNEGGYGAPEMRDQREALFEHHNNVIAQQKALEGNISFTRSQTSQGVRQSLATEQAEAADMDLPLYGTGRPNPATFAPDRSLNITHEGYNPVPAGRTAAIDAGPSKFGPETGLPGPNAILRDAQARMADDVIDQLESGGNLARAMDVSKTGRGAEEIPGAADLVDERLADWRRPLIHPRSTAQDASAGAGTNIKIKTDAEGRPILDENGQYQVESTVKVGSQEDLKPVKYGRQGRVVGKARPLVVKTRKKDPARLASPYDTEGVRVATDKDLADLKLDPEDFGRAVVDTAPKGEAPTWPARFEEPEGPKGGGPTRATHNRWGRRLSDEELAQVEKARAGQGPRTPEKAAAAELLRYTGKHVSARNALNRWAHSRIGGSMEDAYSRWENEAFTVAVDAANKARRSAWAKLPPNGKKAIATRMLAEGRMEDMQYYFGDRVFGAVKEVLGKGRKWAPKKKRGINEAREAPPDWYMDAEDATHEIWEELMRKLAKEGPAGLQRLWSPDFDADLGTVLYKHFQNRAKNWTRDMRAESKMFMDPSLRMRRRTGVPTASDIRDQLIRGLEKNFAVEAGFDPEAIDLIERVRNARAAGFSKEYIAKNIGDPYLDYPAAIKNMAKNDQSLPSIERIENAAARESQYVGRGLSSMHPLGLTDETALEMFQHMATGAKQFEDMPFGSLEEYGKIRAKDARGLRGRLAGNTIAEKFEAGSFKGPKGPRVHVETRSPFEKAIDNPNLHLNVDDIEEWASSAIATLSDADQTQYGEALMQVFNEYTRRAFARRLIKVKGGRTRDINGKKIKRKEYVDEYISELEDPGSPTGLAEGYDKNIETHIKGQERKKSITEGVVTDVAQQLGWNDSQRRQLARKWDKVSKIMEGQYGEWRKTKRATEDKMVERMLSDAAERFRPLGVGSGNYGDAAKRIQGGARSFREKELLHAHITKLEQKLHMADNPEARLALRAELAKTRRNLATLEARPGQARVSRSAPTYGSYGGSTSLPDYSQAEAQQRLRSSSGARSYTSDRIGDPEKLKAEVSIPEDSLFVPAEGEYVRIPKGWRYDSLTGQWVRRREAAQ